MVIDRIGSSPTKRAEVTAEAPKQTPGAAASAASKNDRAERLTERDEIRLSDETRDRTDDVRGPGKDENRKPEDKEREEMKRELEEIKSLLAGLVESFQANEAAAEEGAGASAEASPVEGGMAEATPAQQAQQASPLDNQLFQMILRILSQSGIELPQNGQMGGQFGQMGAQFGQQNGNAQFGQAFPQQMNTSPNFGGIKNDLDVKTKMSGEKLYEIMSTISDPIAQAAFYTQAAGSGRGMNNLAEVVRDKKFGGDQVKMNQWINLHGSGGWAGEPFKSEQYGPASMGRWNFATGEWVGGIAGERTYKIANWNSMA